MRVTGKPAFSFENLGTPVHSPYLTIALFLPQHRISPPAPSWAFPDTKFDQSPSGILAAGNTHCEACYLLNASVNLYGTMHTRALVRRGQFWPCTSTYQLHRGHMQLMNQSSSSLSWEQNKAKSAAPSPRSRRRQEKAMFWEGHPQVSAPGHLQPSGKCREGRRAYPN